MGSIWIKEFTGGLDTRRLPETTPGGVLIKARNGHLTRGGDFQKRAAFVPEYSLPPDTVGMAAGVSNIYVFGSAASPALPTGIAYQRLQHTTPSIDLVRILSVDLYAGKLYVVGEFEDGAIFHFYDGTRVADWFDGRARATFTIDSGGIVAATPAVGSFEVTGGTSNIANQVTSITIDGVNILGAAVTHTGNNNTTAAAVAAQINTYVSVPNYAAAANGRLVTITASATGAGPNGKSITTSLTGDFTVGNFTNMNGGAAAIPSRMLDVQVDGVSIMTGAVSWTSNAVDMAAAIASSINAKVSAPEYTAVASGASVSVVATDYGAAQNGKLVTFTTADGLAVTPATGLILSGGSDLTDGTPVFQPGRFVKTIGQKMYSTSGPNMHFSGIAQPTKWTTDTVGAGFIDMSSEASGAEELVALAKYQNAIAVFAERIVQIWYIDPDPALNRQSQVLNNTGTLSPKSVTQFGDNDIFYLDESGLRSLRARDSSNAAATNDIGVSIDTLIVDKLAEIDIDERQNIIGLIEPRDGRFWLMIKDTIFVFSYFPGSKISAWSTYEPTIVVNDEDVLFPIDDAALFKRRVYIRSGDTIYVYGGLTNGVDYDETQAEAWLPYLDANAPTREKNFTGIDAAVLGEWTVAAAMQPTQTDVEDKVATITETTFNMPGVPAIGSSTHLSLRFRTTRIAAPALLSSAVIHYEGDQIEDK